MVFGAHAAPAIASVGGALVDDYGAFATASLPSGGVAPLASQGFTITKLDTTTGRGAYRFDARVGDGLVPPAWRSDDSPYSLVAFRGPVKAEWKSALLAVADVYDYLPFDSFIVKGERAAIANVPGVAFVGAYHAAYKVEPSLLRATDSMKVNAFTYPDADLAAAKTAVTAAGATVLDWGVVAGFEGILKLDVPADAIERVAQVASVSWMEPTPAGASLDNEHATGIVQNGDPLSRVVNAKGVDGSTQVASICDTGVDTNFGSSVPPPAGTTTTMVHEMDADATNPTVSYMQVNPLHRKILLYYSPVENNVTKGDFDDGDSHGTHTAGTLAGDAPPYNVANNHDSGAYAAKLAVCDLVQGTNFVIPNAYSTMWDPAYAVGARVNSNSWGQTHTNVYTDLARQQDAYVWTHRDFTILRSAGNTGPSGMIRPEAIAKDLLAVASSTNYGSGSIEDLSSFSSRGPAADGRIKPDLDAPGDCLYSAEMGTTSSYICESGTSMSTPTASAAAVLVRDYFAKGFYPGGSAGSGPSLAPSNALVRAVLFAGGHELTGNGGHNGIYFPQMGAVPAAAQGAVKSVLAQAARVPGVQTFPNGNVGWGRINLDSSLYFAGDAKKLWVQDEGAGLATGGTATATIHVADATQPLRIMLVWTDYPGAANANPALVNNLDLQVSAPGGLAYDGNNFLGNATLPGGIPDSINNAETVALNAPVVGDYTITVLGTSVPMGPQPFALVAVGGLS
ncbi:MAG: S8 family serine peptidase [Thermoplasmatota archaeon]